ncbi:MAG: 4-hydroxybenzoate octaprenyltransferase [Planctomycetes bacterium]|nr:4-hydroxybenzoate octaprenyltransferase [Planctomycetota bacterium]
MRSADVAASSGWVAKTAITLEMVKVAHTIFALPFALAALFLAADGWPDTRLLALVVGAMLSARAGAMAFNRLVDADFDAKNPRTLRRALPAGLLTRRFALGFVIVCAAVFVACSAALNRLCFALSPVALAVTLGYSYAKRFTSLCHLWLGVALGIAPLAAWCAVRGVVDASTWIPGALAVAVLFWVAGFDLIYACQDVEFDRGHQLFSLPARLGPARALRLAALFHSATVTALALAGWLADFRVWWGIAVALVAVLLFVQHRVADPAEPKRLELAFFRLNAAIGPLLFAGVLCELFA